MPGRDHRHPWTGADRRALRAAVRTVLPEFPAVAAVYLYGSARHEGTVGDVDLALVQGFGVAPLRSGDFGRFERRVGEAAGRPLPPLDLRRLTPEQYVLGHEILRTGELLAETDPATRLAVEVAVVRDFLDTRWLRESYHAWREQRDGRAA